MPIYMDRHDLDGGVTAEHVAKIHLDDLKIQHEFGCKGLTYWFDGPRKKAFCLIDAPNKEALQEMHNNAHGAIPNSIIEVSPDIVESFLGKIEDPLKTKNPELSIHNSPAFRVLMIIEIKEKSLDSVYMNQERKEIGRFNGVLREILEKNEGRAVKLQLFSGLVSFKSVINAVKCAKELVSTYNDFFNADKTTSQINIGLCAGLPVEEAKGIFEETIKKAERICKVAQGDIVVSSEIKELYENENSKRINVNDEVRSLRPFDEKFLTMLMDFMETNWSKTNLRTDDFSSDMGLSRSQLYRKIKSISGKSLNIFLKEYRLENALRLLNSSKGNISEIAFDTGFNSPAYFSKCFYETYGLLPSDYAKSFASSAQT